MAYDGAEIVERATKFEQQMSQLYERMDTDYRLWRGDKWQPPPILQGFHTRTSNEPQTYGNWVVGTLSQAEVIPRIPTVRGDEDLGKLNADKERFGIGCLTAADTRLQRMFDQPLQSGLSWFFPIRGLSTGVSTLAKRPDGSTYTFIQHWDPRYTSWEMGPDGVASMTYHLRRRKEQVQVQYDAPSLEADTNGYVDLYNQFDRQNNIVVAGPGRILKELPHGAERSPVWLSVVGPQPAIFDSDQSSEAWRHYGESIYRAVRGSFNDINFITSVWMVIVARSAQQGLKIFSEDGKKPVKGNPFLDGANISLKSGGKEDIQPLGLLALAQETPALFGLISAELQRGSLPSTVYGQLGIAISGYAINQLRDSVLTVLTGSIIAMKSVYKQILDNLSEQYVSGYFQPMRVAGYERDRSYFSGVVPIETVQQGGEWEVNIYPSLPQDDAAKIQMSQLARQGPKPLLSDMTLWEEFLKLRDPVLEANRITKQLGESLDPVVVAYKMVKAAEDRGDFEQAKMHYATFQLKMMEMEMRLRMGQAAVQMPSFGPGGAQGVGPGKGLSESVLPRPAQGLPPNAIEPQQGALVSPGAPRPGARNGGTPEEPGMM